MRGDSLIHQLFRIGGAERVSSGHPADHGELVGVDQGPSGSKVRPLLSIQETHKGDDKGIVSCL
jgi:hypothetical protein